nr:hypothetical protein CFP56_19140 [Quercus suber]
MNLDVENTSLKESVKKVTVEIVEVRKQLETVRADPMVERTLSAQKEDYVEKMKKEVEEAMKNFKASKEYSERLMEIEKEMLTMEAEVNNIVAEDAMVDTAENVALVNDNINLE